MASTFIHPATASSINGRMQELPRCNIIKVLLPLNNNNNKPSRLHKKAAYCRLNTNFSISSNYRHNIFTESLIKKKSTTHDLKAFMLSAADLSLPSSLVVKQRQGLGIVKLLKGKSFFVTGATGFLGKAMVEALLRTIPDVGKIYLLIRANNNEAAAKRLKDEVLPTDLFNSLKELHGESYEHFMLSKLVPVAGDVCESDLGLDEHSTAMMAQQVDIIINSAANTSFNLRYDVAINTNTRGPNNVMSFAKKCNNIQVFLHVSTAYVTRQSEGVVTEKLMENYSSDTAEILENMKAPSSMISNILDIPGEINLALSSAMQENGNNNSTLLKMKDLGLERAIKHGWSNAYSFTKMMGEMLLNSTKGDIPVVIVRPTMIEGAIRDPLPGWIEGHKVLDPMLTFYGKGITPGFTGNPNTIMDIIPVDMVVNATIAIINNSEDFMRRRLRWVPWCTILAHQVLTRENPLLNAKGMSVLVKPFKLYDSLLKFNADVWTSLTKSRQQISTSRSSSSSSQSQVTRPNTNNGLEKVPIILRDLKVCKRFAKEIDTFARLYEPYLFFHGRFDTSNTQSVIESLSDEERKVFHFDAKSIDWKDYYLNVHAPGLRKHVIKDQRG